MDLKELYNFVLTTYLLEIIYRRKFVFAFLTI
jgi:hypothetical protein